ncbi:MAG: glycosyltransferase family 4 protein [Kiritimatiellae bacterium]|nr:glycosyltransferase family 4 protein [Kiritimatiellia bacterium]
MTFLFPTPVIYDGNESRYLQRDGARFAQYLSEQGHIAKKIIISGDSIKGIPSSSLLEAAPLADWYNSAFWAKYNADSVLLYGGFAPRMLAIAKAIRKSTPFLALKLDSSFGVHSPFYMPCLMIKKKYHIYRQTKPYIVSAIGAILWWVKQATTSKKSFYREYFPLFDLITAESSIAAENTRNYFKKIGLSQEAEKVTVLPHPVSTSFSDAIPCTKENLIIAIAADWTNPLKGGKLLIKTLTKTLARHTGYSAIIVGDNTDKLKALSNKAGDDIAKRIQFLGKLDSDQIAPYYHKSKIHIIASGSESGPITASEALSCGCSLVFTKNLLQLQPIADSGFATISKHRTPSALANALSAEITKWQVPQNYQQCIQTTFLHNYNISDLINKLTSYIK